MSSSHSYDTCTSIGHKRGRAGFGEDSPDSFVSLDDVPPRPMQRRKVLESSSPLPSKRMCSPPVTLENHSSLDLSSPSEDPTSRPSPHPVMEPVSAGADVSGNSSIIDRSSIPSPPKDTTWTSMPAVIDVPNSDFLESNSQLPHVPDLEYHSTAGSNPFHSLGDWPSLGEPSYLSSSPISSSSSASLYSETPSTSQVVNWSDLTKFIDPVFPTPSQSSSQTSLSTPPSTLPNSQEDSLLIPLPPSCGLNQLGSLLDPSTPPGALLPIQPDVFAEDMHLWPLLYWVS
ncbi:hypothetical protein BC827DRAFT_1263130 [Russula dissimulans]|nr:hypothetical protein BC827DRAFT_1263130 [Russula dissimulans]